MGFRGVDVEGEGKAPEPIVRFYLSRIRLPRIKLPRFDHSWRSDVAWRRLVIVVLYIAVLLGLGAILARSVSVQAGAGLVVAGLLVLLVMAFKSRNRSADAGLDASGGAYAGGGGWEVGAGGGDGGGGGGDGGG